MEKKTPLYDAHVKAGARIVPFAGYLMPIQYSGIIEEHRAVRERLGLFDLSHMGEFRVSGRDRIAQIDRLMTNDIAGLEVGQVRYTPMCYADGGIVDDLLVYRFDDHLMLVVNASNIDKDFEWIRENVSGDVAVTNVSDETALIAVQGPLAEQVLGRCAQLDLSAIRYYHFLVGQCAGRPAIVSRTGYTGEDGFELYLDRTDAEPVWEALLEEGRAEGLKPVGLGARDTLRLEAGYMLYGNDIDETTSPLEAGLGWTVKFGPDDFIGRQALEQQKEQGMTRRMAAVDMADRAIPRQHHSVWVREQHVGELTSGTFSPTFGRGIGLAYVDRAFAKVGSEVAIEIRDQKHPARLVKKPMYKREGA